jgi:hypothetical protein
VCPIRDLLSAYHFFGFNVHAVDDNTLGTVACERRDHFFAERPRRGLKGIRLPAENLADFLFATLDLLVGGWCICKPNW